MANLKPLPALPFPSSSNSPPNPSTTLSVEARAHRRRLILLFLADVCRTDPSLRKDWGHVFEDVLDGFGKAMGGVWLGSVRRGREVKMKGKEEGKEEKERETKAKGKEKEKDHQPENEESKEAAPNAEKPLPSEPLTPLDVLRKLAARPPPAISRDEPKAGHLVLCVAPHGSHAPLPAEDSGFDVVPANIGCVFEVGRFALQGTVEVQKEREGEGTVLFGLDGVDPSLLATPLRLLGGTFTFKGLTSANQHLLLSQVLRLSIYTHLSLILEQHVLAGLGVQLRYPIPRLGLQSSTSAKLLERSQTQPKSQTRRAIGNEEKVTPVGFGSGLRRRLSAVPTSFKFAGFFGRNQLNSNLHLDQRAQTDQPASTSHRGRSLDLAPLSHSVTLATLEESTTHTHARRPIEGHHDHGGNHLHIPLRLHRFSFMAKKQQQHPEQHSSPSAFLDSSSNDPSQSQRPFAAALAYLERNKELLSTSPGVSIPPPKLLIDLAKKERTVHPGHGPGPGKRPSPQKGDERVGLGSLLGWDGNGATRMGGTPGFARQQGISVLWGLYLPRDRVKEKEVESTTSSTLTASSSATSSSRVTSNTTTTTMTGGSTLPATSSTVTTTSHLHLAPCAKPRWVTYRYYSFPSPSLSSSPSSSSAHPSTPTTSAHLSTPKNAPAKSIPPTDVPLGDILTAWIRERHLKCSERTGTGSGVGCAEERGRHQRRVAHGGVRIFIDVAEWEGVEVEAEAEERVKEAEKEGEDKEEQQEGVKEKKEGEEKAEEKAAVSGEEADNKEAEVEEKQELDEGKPHHEVREDLETKLKDNHLSKDANSASNSNSKPNPNDGSIQTWSSCAVCGAKSARRKMDDGTFLFSFAKFLELLIYSPMLTVLTTPPCDHTTPTAGPESPPNPGVGTRESLPAYRFNIVRHFGLGGSSSSSPHTVGSTPPNSHISESKVRGEGGQVTFTLSAIEDIFELCVPRLQVIKGMERGVIGPLPSPGVGVGVGMEAKRRTVAGVGANTNEGGLDKEVEQKRMLRREIKKWWEGVADHVDRIEKALNARDLRLVQKALPRLPSVDDAYDVFHSETPPGERTPKGPSSPKLAGMLPSLPPLPASTPGEDEKGEGYFGADEIAPVAEKEEDGEALPKAKAQEGPSILTSPSVISVAPDLPPKDRPLSPRRDRFSNSNAPAHLPVPPNPNPNPREDSALLLASLRHTFHRLEQGLYAQLARTPEGSLNDVRRAFVAVGRGTERRLGAWQGKHLRDLDWGAVDVGGVGNGVELRGNGVEKGTEKGQEREKGKNKEKEKERGQTGKNSNLKDRSKGVGELHATEPEWWGKGCHVLPGGNVVVREGDWGSIIAHTLSTTDYQMELANLTALRHQTAPTTPAASPSTASAGGDSAPSSFFSVAAKYKLFGSGSRAQPDPDTDDAVWNEQEQYSAVISRKEHGHDTATTLLSLRDVLRQRAIPEASTSTLTSPAPGMVLSPKAGADAPGSSSTVKAKADVSVSLSMEAAGGQLNVNAPGPMLLASPSVEKLLELEGTILTPGVAGPSGPPSIKSYAVSNLNSSQSQSNASSGFIDVDAHIRRTGAESVLSRESGESEDTIRRGEVKRNSKSNGGSEGVGGSGGLPPPLPPKDPPAKGKDRAEAVESKGLELEKPESRPPPPNPAPQPSTSSSFASTLASGIQSVAMRLMMQSEPVSRTTSPPNVNAKKHHNLLLTDVGSINERPHIKYDWTVGKRLKFSCTVYYAKQFDLLRRKCGIQDVYLKSLSRSVNWAAEGGKSRSNFWKTSDERFIIKTLVNAWNVADLQVLMELAPSYFRYMDATACKATVLAKMVGFYTVELRNLETGTVQSKADVLVMENLFYDRNISKTFDLKGIQGRKVKAHGHTSKTLFDGDWIEGQLRTLTLVHPHSKVVLRDAIKSDAEYLAKSNIMDYSLLVGVDEEKKQIACGLVDTIGSYTFAKTLEYKAKHGLQTGGKEVTVVPPNVYQDRFVSALDGYFVACPDKWSEPLDESRVISDPNVLPSIL